MGGFIGGHTEAPGRRKLLTARRKFKAQWRPLLHWGTASQPLDTPHTHAASSGEPLPQPHHPSPPPGLGGWDTRPQPSGLPPPAVLLIAVTFKKGGRTLRMSTSKGKEPDLGSESHPALLPPTPPADTLHPSGPGPHHPSPAARLDVCTLPLLGSSESLPKSKGGRPSPGRRKLPTAQGHVPAWATAGSTPPDLRNPQAKMPRALEPGSGDAGPLHPSAQATATCPAWPPRRAIPSLSRGPS